MECKRHCMMPKLSVIQIIAGFRVPAFRNVVKSMIQYNKLVTDLMKFRADLTESTIIDEVNKLALKGDGHLSILRDCIYLAQIGQAMEWEDEKFKYVSRLGPEFAADLATKLDKIVTKT